MKAEVAFIAKSPMPQLIMLGIKAIETKGGPPAGDMRPQGVKPSPGCSIDRGDRVAIVVSRKTFTYDEYPEAWDRLAEATGWPDVSGRSLADRFKHDAVASCPLGSVLGTVRVDDALPIAKWGELGVALRWAPPRQQAIAVNGAELDVVEYHPDDDEAPGWQRSIGAGGYRLHSLDDQLPLGDFRDGRWGWLLSDPQPLREWWCEADAIGYPKLRCTERAPHGPSCGWRNLPPVPCPGKGPDGERRSLQGVFRLPDDVAAQMEAHR